MTKFETKALILNEDLIKQEFSLNFRSDIEESTTVRELANRFITSASHVRWWCNNNPLLREVDPVLIAKKELLSHLHKNEVLSSDVMNKGKEPTLTGNIFSIFF